MNSSRVLGVSVGEWLATTTLPTQPKHSCSRSRQTGVVTSLLRYPDTTCSPFPRGYAPEYPKQRL